LAKVAEENSNADAKVATTTIDFFIKHLINLNENWVVVND
jgi:hypothetical protein